MSKRFQANRKEFPFKSAISIKSFATKQRGHIYSSADLNRSDGITIINCIWKGKPFTAKTMDEARKYVHFCNEVL